MTLGQKIRQARVERGMTQKQLVGDHITRNMLSKIENDSATPSVRTLEYLASRLGLTAGYFMADYAVSDGTSPDGLDDMRKAYREGRYKDCIALLGSAKTQGTTDEGYILHAKSALAAAREALAKGDVVEAKEYADDADYYNKEGLYYSAEIDAEMSLILAECALTLDLSEFEENAKEYERAVKDISFTQRYELARVDYLLKSGESELAGIALDKMGEVEERYKGAFLFLKGVHLMSLHDYDGAVECLLKAEPLVGDTPRAYRLYEAVEMCYKELEDFKKAYEYAAKQLRD